MYGRNSGSEVDPIVLSHVLRGLHFLAVGHPGAAVPDLQFALADDPQSPFIYEHLFTAWEESGNRSEAQRVLAAGLVEAPAAPALNLIAGELAMEDHRFADATVALQRATTDDALLARAGSLWVDALLWDHKLQPAEAVARQLVQRAPGDATLAYALATTLEDHRRFEAALEMYRRARKQRPSDTTVALGEARVLALMGHYAAAAQSIVPLFQFYPDQLVYYLEVVRLLRRAHSPEADTYRSEALRLSEGDLEGRVRIAALDFSTGHRNAGVALAREAVQTWPLRLEPRLLLAEVLQSDHDALGCLAILQGSANGPAVLYRRRGECQAVEAHFDAMLDELTQAARAGPIRDELIAATGILCRYASNEAQAQVWRRQLLSHVDTQASADDALFSEIVLLDYFNHSEAYDLLDRLSPKARSDMDFVLRFTDLASRYGKLDEAVAVLERLLQQNPQDPVLLNALGFTLADADLRLDEAEVWLQRAYRMAPSRSFVADSLGWVLFRRGNLSAAAQLLEEARDLDPDDAEILRHLGDVYLASRHQEAARACFLRALTLRPAIALRALLQTRLTGLSS